MATGAPATAPDFFTEDTPTAVLVRQVLGAIAQFDKATTIAKLKAARSPPRWAFSISPVEVRLPLAAQAEEAAWRKRRLARSLTAMRWLTANSDRMSRFEFLI